MGRTSWVDWSRWSPGSSIKQITSYKIFLGMEHLTKTFKIGTAAVTRIDEIPLANLVPSILYPDLEARALEEYRRFLTDGPYDRNPGRLTQTIHTYLVRFSGATILYHTW